MKRDDWLDRLLEELDHRDPGESLDDYRVVYRPVTDSYGLVDRYGFAATKDEGWAGIPIAVYLGETLRQRVSKAMTRAMANSRDRVSARSRRG